MPKLRPMIGLLAASLLVAGVPLGAARGLAPVGGVIAFSREHEGTRHIYTVDPTLGSVQAVTSDGMLDADPAWSPDGTSLAFAGKTAKFSVVSHIYALDAAGQRHQLTTTQAVDRSPAWSPDGVRIAFSRSSGTGGDSRIWLMRSDGTMQRALTTGGFKVSQGSPAWSPDGTRIAYTGTQNGLPQIYALVMNGDGSVAGKQRLTDDAFSDGSPAWSPDGTKLAFERCCPQGHSLIEVMDASTRVITDVTAGQVEASHPTWSPDGSTISFVGYPLAGGSPGIYTVQADGTELRQVTTDADPDFTPAWQPASAPVPVETHAATAATPAVPAAPAGKPHHHHKHHRYQTLSSHLVAPGVRFQRIVDHAGPNRVYVLRIDTRRRVSIDTALADDRIGGFERVRSTARRHHAVAAVNGDFGIGTGRHHHPGALGRPMHLFADDGNLRQSMFGSIWNFGLGARIGDGEVFSPPTRNNKVQLGRPKPKVYLRDDVTGLSWPINRFNEGLPLGSGRPGWGEIEAYTRVAKEITASPTDMCSARLVPAGPPQWAVDGQGVRRPYTVDVSQCSRARIPPEAGVVLSALPTDQQAAVIRALGPGDPVTLRWTLGWGESLDGVGGYPLLVDRGRVVARTCGTAFCWRNPRTAIGVTGSGRVLLVAVDGRIRTSVGMNLVEEARLLRHLGAVEAMNVDGGGSTTMVVRGRVVNHPSDGRERGVTNSILVLRGSDPGEPPSLTGHAAAGPAVIPPSGAAFGPPAAGWWRAAESDRASTGGLLDAIAGRWFAGLPPELRAILRAYRAR